MTAGAGGWAPVDFRFAELLPFLITRVTGSVWQRPYFTRVMDTQVDNGLLALMTIESCGGMK